MEVIRLHDLDSCRRIASAWDCMAHSIPFRRTAWLHSWWDHYRGTGEAAGELFVLQVSDEAGEIVGVAPWFKEQSLYQGRVVRPLGAGKVCSEYLGILTTAEHEQDVVRALAQWLVAAADGRQGAENCWDLMELVSVDREDAVMLSLVAARSTLAALASAERRFAFYLPAVEFWGIM